MRQLKHGKSILLWGIIGLVETIIWSIIIFTMKDAILDEYRNILERLITEAGEQEAVDIVMSTMNMVAVSLAVWMIISGGIVFILSISAKKIMGANIAIIVVTVCQGFPMISSLVIIVYGILNVVDAAKRKREVIKDSNY